MVFKYVGFLPSAFYFVEVMNVIVVPAKFSTTMARLSRVMVLPLFNSFMMGSSESMKWCNITAPVLVDNNTMFPTSLGYTLARALALKLSTCVPARGSSFYPHRNVTLECSPRSKSCHTSCSARFSKSEMHICARRISWVMFAYLTVQSSSCKIIVAACRKQSPSPGTLTRSRPSTPRRLFVMGGILFGCACDVASKAIMRWDA